jgi:hypothetical protein
MVRSPFLQSLERIIELGNSILETEDVNKSNLLLTKKKKLTKSPPAKHLAQTFKDLSKRASVGEDVVISAKKRVPGMVPRSKRMNTTKVQFT